MLTPRGLWLLVIVLLVLALAALGNQNGIALLSLAFLFWFAGQWILFALQVRSAVTSLHARRRLDGKPPGRVLLWADRPVRVCVHLECFSWLGLAHLEVHEQLPALGTTNGRCWASGPCTPRHALDFEYEYQATAAGRVRWDGLQLLMSDLQGLFFCRRFLRDPVEVTVLPPFVDVRGRRTGLKRFNQVPLQGVHRYRRPGSGTELLDLRDYIPGDPPKTIAWKVSARRDRLITKEYESEVPIRCTLFVDVSDSVRVGIPGQTALDHAVQIAAGLTQQLATARDPVGLCLVDGKRVEILPCGSGIRHAMRARSRLAQAAAKPVAPSECPAELLLEPLRALCTQVYPETSRLRILQACSPFGRAARLLAVLLAGLFWLALGALLVWLFWLARQQMIEYTLALGAALLSLLNLSWLIIRWRRRLGKASGQGMRRLRRTLSTVLATHYRLGAGGAALLARDDDAFSYRAQCLLAEHRRPYRRPLYGRNGRYLFESPEKIDIFARSLLQAESRGRDNELFVLLVDLLDCPQRWQPLVQAVKLSLARHHQVVLICPWPNGLPSPTGDSWHREEQTVADLEGRRLVDPALALRRLDFLRYQRAYRQLQAEFARLGAPTLCAPASDSIRYLLERIERLRAARVAPCPTRHAPKR